MLRVIGQLAIVLAICVLSSATIHADESYNIEIVLPDRVDPFILGQTTVKDLRKQLGRETDREKDKSGTNYIYPGMKFYVAKKQDAISSIHLSGTFETDGAVVLKDGMPALEARRMMAEMYGRPLDAAQLSGRGSPLSQGSFSWIFSSEAPVNSVTLHFADGVIDGLSIAGESQIPETELQFFLRNLAARRGLASAWPAKLAGTFWRTVEAKPVRAHGQRRSHHDYAASGGEFIYLREDGNCTIFEIDRSNPKYAMNQECDRWFVEGDEIAVVTKGDRYVFSASLESDGSLAGYGFGPVGVSTYAWRATPADPLAYAAVLGIEDPNARPAIAHTQQSLASYELGSLSWEDFVADRWFESPAVFGRPGVLGVAGQVGSKIHVDFGKVTKQSTTKVNTNSDSYKMSLAYLNSGMSVNHVAGYYDSTEYILKSANARSQFAKIDAKNYVEVICTLVFEQQTLNENSCAAN
ncbi:MAG: hypothetical protein ACR2QT_06655 [Woeseiaceae bacterium]